MQDDYGGGSPEELDLYLQFNLVLRDVSAFLVDGDYCWSQSPSNNSAGCAKLNGVSLLPLFDKCGVTVKLQQVKYCDLFSLNIKLIFAWHLQRLRFWMLFCYYIQIRLESPSYPSTRVAVRLPSLGFHFSPARYHRLMQIAKIFEEDSEDLDLLCPWNEPDFEGWLSLLAWKVAIYLSLPHPLVSHLPPKQKNTSQSSSGLYYSAMFEHLLIPINRIYSFLYFNVMIGSRE